MSFRSSRFDSISIPLLSSFSRESQESRVFPSTLYNGFSNDKSWESKFIDQSKRNDIAVWDNDGNLIS